MTKRSWPFGVTSWEDTVKFAQLVFGANIAVENYSDRLPHFSQKSFLLFARGACGEDSPLHKVADLIEPQLDEIRLSEINMRASARPTKSQQVLQNNGAHTYYWASQLTRAPCTCRSFFGADKHMKHVPTCSSNWNAGDRFAKLWDATLLKNFEMFQNRNLRPIWLDKSWQALWNWNDHNQGHGIDVHADVCSTYSRLGPITSLSFGRGGVLTLGTSKGKAPTKMLFQEDGDALIMAGDFQSEFVHGVPPRSSWSHLKNLPMFTGMKEWEKVGLDREIHMHETAVPGAQHVRMNCTIRWHDTHTHMDAMHAGQGITGVSGTQPVFTGAVRTCDDSDDPWAVHEPLQTNVSDVSAGKFAGIRMPGMTGAGHGRFLEKGVQADGLHDTIQTLLACLY